ncbi:MAG: hypothetical protein HMLIMOIP_000302 [Candidatus Nitrosomirales archaeon]|jgi:hypothetical protein
MFANDFGSERATSIDDYKITCIRFIDDLSDDYEAWVDRYRLPEEERKFRKNAIQEVVKTTNEWIGKFGNSIKKIDVIKDDGINKMAESTAGYPFEFIVNVDGQSRYVHHEQGQIKLNIKAKAGENRQVKISRYSKEWFAQILSSANVSVNENLVNFVPKEVLDDFVILDASACKPSDIISITITVEEVSDNVQVEKRGLSTIFRIK